MSRRILAALLAAAALTAAPAPACAQTARDASNVASTWSEADIRASRVAGAATLAAVDRPGQAGDPESLLLVVEAGDRHVSVVEGERFERVHRFALAGAPQGEPAFTPDGRFAFFGTLDGWIAKFDLREFAVVARVRAGLELSGIAVSGDGRWVMAANRLPHTLALFDADLGLARVYPATSADGARSSPVVAVRAAPARSSFIVALGEIPELWEISYDPRAEDIYDGMVHDFRMGEGVPRRGFLGIRRTTLPAPLGGFVFDRAYAEAIGSARASAGGEPAVEVVNLDVRRRVATLPVSGFADPASATRFTWRDVVVLAFPGAAQAAIHVVDMKDWRPIRSIPVTGNGRFVTSHARTPHVWAGSAAGDVLTIIDKATLEPVGELRPSGGPPGHVGFTRDGRHALVSLSGIDGALVVYDAQTLTEIARLPMRGPSGSYSVGNRVIGAGRMPR